jgi:hypothetical protein
MSSAIAGLGMVGAPHPHSLPRVRRAGTRWASSSIRLAWNLTRSSPASQAMSNRLVVITRCCSPVYGSRLVEMAVRTDSCRAEADGLFMTAGQKE